MTTIVQRRKQQDHRPSPGAMDPAAQLAHAVTERVIIPVRGSVDNWKEQLKSMLQTLQSQPGHLRTRWGPWSEDPQRLELLTGT